MPNLFLRAQAHDDAIKKKRNGTVERVGVFTTVDDKMLYKWVACGHTFKRLGGQVTSDRRFPKECPRCRLQKQFDEKLKKATGDTLRRVPHSVYVNIDASIALECQICGYLFTETPKILLRRKHAMPDHECLRLIS